MLTTNKTTTVTGYSYIDGKQAVYLAANVSRDNVGNTYINQTITDPELYNANRVECRKDIADFQAEVYAVEDSYIADMEQKEAEETAKKGK